MNREQLYESLRDRDYRDIFADEQVDTDIAYQLRLLREARGWTQEEMAARLGKAQEMISRWENPDYGRYTTSTLKEFRKAFDVALAVRFIPFRELADWTTGLSINRLVPPSYEEERATVVPKLDRLSPAAHLADSIHLWNVGAAAGFAYFLHSSIVTNWNITVAPNISAYSLTVSEQPAGERELALVA